MLNLDANDPLGKVPPFHGSCILAGHRTMGQAPRLLNTAVITAQTHLSRFNDTVNHGSRLALTA